jgi:hypothetical protein
MFVGVTGFAFFVGYHVNWIRQRHDFLRVHQEPVRGKPILWDGTFPEAPGLLWLFGEEACWGIDLSSEDQEIRDRVRRLFPESRIFNIK